MTQLLIQPSGGTRAQEHYRDTILNLVSFTRHSNSLNEQTLQTLETLFPDGSCAMWGLVPGSNDANRNKWERIEISDAVVFTGKKKIFATGQIAIKFHNPELALNLWGVDDDGQTWEYMYALTNITETDIPYETFNAVIGDSPNNNHMGFRIVGDEKAAPFLEFIGRELPLPQPTTRDIVAAIRGLQFEEIQTVIDEWNHIGRDAFLETHSLSGAVKYLLKWGDASYDAKAIAVQAVRAKHSEMGHLRANAFQGDVNTIAIPLRQAGWEVLDKTDVAKEIDEETQVKDITDRVGIGPVEKQNLVKSRRGQGIFRHNVLNREKQCRVTKITDPDHLRASHIKPWSKSTDTEKLDGNNGLMLAPHVDHLFDKGWITFTGNGDIILSPHCHPDIFAAFGISGEMNVGAFTPEQDVYLSYHRLNIHKQ
jgi:hypothetical protein